MIFGAPKFKKWVTSGSGFRAQKWVTSPENCVSYSKVDFLLRSEFRI